MHIHILWDLYNNHYSYIYSKIPAPIFLNKIDKALINIGIEWIEKPITKLGR